MDYSCSDLPGSGGPKRKLANEKPPGRTIDYDLLLNVWREGGDSK